MRQFQMIQDWGYNYLYLRHEGVITRVNLKNHEYRDVTYSPIEEFDSASSKERENSTGQGKELWICGASSRGFQSERAILDRVMIDEAYSPLPFPEHLIDPQEWIHVLATLIVSALLKQTKFYDKDGYDIIPIQMIKTIIHNDEPSQEKFHETQSEFLLEDSVSIQDVLYSDYSTVEDDDDGLLGSLDEPDIDDAVVSKEDLEKVRILLRGRDSVDLDLPKHESKRKFCKSHRKYKKKAIAEAKLNTAKEIDDTEDECKTKPELPPQFKGKNEFLYYVEAKDLVKADV